MKKWHLFNYIFFSLFTLFLHPIFGMEANYKPKKISKKAQKEDFAFQRFFDDYDKTSSSTDPIQSNDPISSMFPDEIFVMIFTFVLETGTPKNFNALAGVNRNWNRIWQDKKLQELFIIKLSKDINFKLFESAAKKTKVNKTNHEKALTVVKNLLQKTGYFNLQMFYILHHNNVHLTDIFPDALKSPTLQRHALEMKFGKTNELIKFIKAHKNDPSLPKLLNSPVPENPKNRTLFMCTFVCPDIIKQEELRDLFIKRGADASAKDANGNTVLHHAVISAVKISKSTILFNLLKRLYYAWYDYRTLLSIRNKQGLTPADLAYKLIRKSKQTPKASEAFKAIQGLFEYINSHNDNDVGLIFNMSAAGFSI